MKRYMIHDMEKWMHQNEARCIGVFEGCLLDNEMYECKRGWCAVYERYLTPNSSGHEMVFAPYKDMEAVDRLWAEWYDRMDEAEAA